MRLWVWDNARNQTSKKLSFLFYFFLENIYWSSYRYFDNWEKQMRTNIRIVDIYIRHIHKTNRSHTFFNYKCAFASPWQKHCRNPMLNCNTSSTYSLTGKKLFFFFFLRANSKCEVWARCPEDTENHPLVFGGEGSYHIHIAHKLSSRKAGYWYRGQC